MSNPTHNPGPGAYPAAPPPPPKKKRTGLIVLIVIGVIVIAFIAACGSIMSNIASSIGSTTTDPGVVVSEGASEKPSAKTSDKGTASKDEEEKPKEDYTIKATECARGDYGSVDIKVKVTNNTERKMQYWFDIAIEDTDGNTVGTGSGFIDNVKPGKTGTASVYAHMTDEEYEGKIKCVIDVTDFGEF